MYVTLSILASIFPCFPSYIVPQMSGITCSVVYSIISKIFWDTCSPYLTWLNQRPTGSNLSMTDVPILNLCVPITNAPLIPTNQNCSPHPPFQKPVVLAYFCAYLRIFFAPMVVRWQMCPLVVSPALDLTPQVLDRFDIACQNMTFSRWAYIFHIRSHFPRHRKFLQSFTDALKMKIVILREFPNPHEL